MTIGYRKSSINKGWFKKGVIPIEAIEKARIANKGGNKTSFKKGDPGFWTGKKRLHMTGKNHFNWSDTPSYMSVHSWIRRILGKAQKCENSFCVYPRTRSNGFIVWFPKKFEWANISRKYKRDVTDYISLCCSCHHYFDNNNWSVEELKKICQYKYKGHRKCPPRP